jgi:hypothetical protein
MKKLGMVASASASRKVKNGLQQFHLRWFFPEETRVLKAFLERALNIHGPHGPSGPSRNRVWQNGMGQLMLREESTGGA